MASVENIKQKEVVFSEGSLSESINILTDGTINVYTNVNENGNIKNYKLFSIPKNMLVGIESSINYSKYSFTFKADSDVNIQKIHLSDDGMVRKFFNANKNYITYTIRSLSYMAIKITDTLHSIDIMYKDIATVLNNLSILFWSIKNDDDYTSKNDTINKLKDVFLDAKKVGIRIPNECNSNFIKKHDDAIFSDIYPIMLDDDTEDDDRLNFYKRLLKIPETIQEQFFSYDIDFALMFANDISKYIFTTNKTLKNYLFTCYAMIDELSLKQGNSILSEYISIAEKMKNNNWDNSTIITACNFILDYAKDISNYYNNTYERELLIDDTKLKKVIESNICVVKSRDDIDTIEIVSGVENMPQELDKSAKKLLDAANLDIERSKHMLDSINQFKKVKDKLSSDDDVRLIRKSINSIFFDVYSAIAKKVIVDGDKDKLYQMFLDYSFFDEELLSKKNIIDLYNQQDNTSIKNSELKVYTQKELLKKIYDKELMPSINPLGQTYDEHLRERMKRGEFNEEGYNSIYENANERFNYEISGMISHTQRMCYGQISSYSSILHEDMILKDIGKSFSNRESIENAINNILKIDFSAFYRETLYKNSDLKIEKEIIMEEIYPEFILSPTYGSRSIMWQELNGRNKRSRGRILIPILTNEELEQILINAIGAFRWELCKSVLGYSWNDVTTQSLTSEYYNYVTFYRRNKDLGEEAREKLVAQIKKTRNNMRELFVSDYFVWLKYESQSIIRLNKVARGIMYRNVPFAKQIRDSIGKQPIFNDISYKFEGLRKKRAQEIENRYARYKSNETLPNELLNYINFFKNM